VVTILATWGLFKQWRKWQHGEPWEFSSRRTVVLAVLVGLAFVLPATLYGWSVVNEHVMDSRPDLSYYTFTDGVEDERVAFEAYLIDDMDTVLFQDRVLAFFVEDNRTALNLRSTDLGSPLGVTETELLTVIGDSGVPLNARGTTTAVVEGDSLVVYYSYIVHHDGRTDSRTWRIGSQDGSNWTTPEPVPGEPDDGPNTKDLPRAFEWYRYLEAYEHRMYRTSSGGDLMAVVYYHDEGDYPDWKGTYFAYRPKGGEWSDLVSVGYVHRLPQDVHELSDGTFLVVNQVNRDKPYYRVDTFRFGPEDFEDLTGPFYVV
jgi:hypothetical protein